MTVYSAVMWCVCEWQRVDWVTLLYGEGDDAQHIVVYCEREHYCSSSFSSAKGGTSMNCMKSLELITSKHPEKLWNGCISAVQVELQCLQQSCSLSMLYLSESGIHRFRPPRRTCRCAKSNLNPLQKADGSVPSCHRAQLQSWQGAQLGLS